MVRLCLATLIVAAGLGLVCGCCGWPQCPLLGRFRAHAPADCCEGGVLPDSQGPIVEGPEMNGAMPGGPAITPIPSVAPQNTLPPLAPPPRIVPQPQAQPGPYTP